MTSSIKTPIKIDGVNENIYAGFWIRLGSILVDFIILLPVMFLTLYLNGLSANAYYFTFIPSLAFHFWYGIYLVQKNGGTPGKLICNIKIYRIDGSDIQWREAILRNSVSYVLYIFAAVITMIAISKADTEHFDSLTWMTKQQYLMALSPVLFSIYSKVSTVWTYSELFVLLFNKRKRAIHDYIAGTVIIRTQYINQVRAAMTEIASDGNENPTHNNH